MGSVMHHQLFFLRAGAGIVYCVQQRECRQSEHAFQLETELIPH